MMDKKKMVIIGVVVVIVIAIIAVVVSAMRSNTKLEHDGETGIATFENVKDETGFGVEIEEGEWPIEVSLTKGTIHIRISKGDDAIFEADVEESQTLVAIIPETNFYMVTLTGDNGTGTITYPVSDTFGIETPDIIEDMEIEEYADTDIPNRDMIEKRESVKLAIREYFEKNFEGIVEDVKFLNVKVYTQEEIDENPMLKDYNIGDNDIAFEIEYQLKIAEGYDDMMQFTAGTGVIDGQWVKEKFNLRYCKI